MCSTRYLAEEFPRMNDTRFRRIRDRARGPSTLVNDGLKISGRLSGSGDVHVLGHVDGDCDLDGCLTLAETGHWIGTINAGDVIIAGRVEGDIVASGRIEITGTARISGTVSGEGIAVAEGAVVDGVMNTGDKAAPTEFVEKRTR